MFRFYLFWLLLGMSGVAAADLTFTPAAPVVEVDKEITLSVAGTTGAVTWSVQKGNILNSGTEVIYRAPLEKPLTGFDVVTVSDAAGNIGTLKVQIVAKSNFSLENAVWEIFTNRSNIQALLLSEDGKTLWVGTTGGLEKRDAQTGDIQQVFLNTDGLPGNWVTSLLSDGQGGLWVGTGEGLAHYTAQGEWQTFNTENSGLPNNWVESLLSDGQGGLWVGNSYGLTRYTAQGEWQIFNEANSGLPSDSVNSLLSDGQGGLWIGTGGGGLAHYTAQGTWQTFNTENSGLPDYYVDSLLSDGQGGLWVGNSYGLTRYTAQGEWQTFNTKNSGLPGNEVDSLLSDGQGGLWVGTRYGGLARYTAQGEWQTFNTKNSGLPGNGVDSLLSDGQGGLWVGTAGGLAHYTAQGEWQVFNMDNSGLSDNWITSLSSDGQGGLWIGTWGGGLAHYTAQGEWQIFNEANSGLSDNRVNSLLNDGQGGLWIGTYDRGLAHYTAQGEWQTFNTKNSGLPGNYVYSLLSDGQAGLWVGTWGLAHYTAQREWQVFNTDNSGLSDNRVNSLLSDGQGGLWVGTDEGGLAHYTAQGEWQVFNTNNSGLPSDMVTSLLSDGQSGLWIGTYKGGLVHYIARGEWQIFNEANSGLPDNHVWSLLSDGQGGLWVGTRYGGLARYTAQGEWQIFNEANSSLPGNWVASLLSDGRGGLWIGSSSSGLAHLTFPEKQRGNRAAMIIASGGNHQENSLWEATESITNYIYKMLAGRKFVNEEIYYVSSKDWADFNGDGFNDRIVDAPQPERSLMLDDIRQAFEWAKNRGKLDQPLYVFFMDHGGTEKLLLNKTDYMQSTDLKALLDDYQAVTGSQVVLVIEACYSGSHLPILAAPNRAIISSAKADEQAYFEGEQGFTRFLTKYLFTGANFKESYELAQRDQNRLLGKLSPRTGAADTTETARTKQSAQLDDTGDGIYDLAQDGQWLKQVRINGDLQMADFTLAVENLTPATTVTTGQPLLLKAKVVTANNDVKLVWAVIRPPRMNRVIDTNGTPILAFPRQELVKTPEKDIYQTTWNNAVYNGDYEITFYAEDKQGNIAGSETSVTITVTGGVEPPLQATVTFQLEKDRYQRGETFKATLTEDLGWGYDLYIGVQLPDGQILTMSDRNQFAPLNPPAKWWSGRARSQHAPLTIVDLTLPQELPTGHYCLYGVLSPERNDVFQAKSQGLWVVGQRCFEIE